MATETELDFETQLEIANDSLNTAMREKDELSQRLTKTEEQLRIFMNQATIYRNALLQLAKEINM